ncbi:MAG TPA: DUF4384 domain-containing protein [Bryobacteraceae bacterium]|nr:DUF4384 domain-containing protein [Bryobacteraceae bacterium]
MLRLPCQAACLGAGLLIFTAVYAQDNGLNARDAFWSAADLVGKRPQSAPQPHAKPATTAQHVSSVQSVSVKAPLGLRYSVLKKKSDGTFEEVPPDSEFHAGDSIRLSLMSNQAGYLYIIQHGSSGKWRPLYPPPGATEAKLGPGQEYLVPGNGSFQFDADSGQEKLFVLLSRAPETNLDETIASLQRRNGGALDDQLVAQLQGEVQSRDLVFTKADDNAADSAQGDKATYVINKASDKTEDPHIVVNVVLSHK